MGEKKKEKLGQEPAYPCLEYNEVGYGNAITINLLDGSKQFIPFKEGMSKRFYAACTVLQGFASDPEINGPLSEIIKSAYDWADELLKQEND